MSADLSNLEPSFRGFAERRNLSVSSSISMKNERFANKISTPSPRYNRQKSASEEILATDLNGVLIEDYFSISGRRKSEMRRTVSEGGYDLDFESLGSAPSFSTSYSSLDSLVYSPSMISFNREDLSMSQEIMRETGISLQPKKCCNCCASYFSPEVISEFCSGECKSSYYFKNPSFATLEDEDFES